MLLYHSISCPLENSRKQSRHKIWKGTRVEEDRRSKAELYLGTAFHKPLQTWTDNSSGYPCSLIEYVNPYVSCDTSVTQVGHGGQECALCDVWLKGEGLPLTERIQNACMAQIPIQPLSNPENPWECLCVSACVCA